MKNEDTEEENFIINENGRESKISLGIFTNKLDNDRNSEITESKNYYTTDYLTTPLASESESNVNRRKKKTNTLSLLLRNTFNIPFITGIVAIMLTTIPFVRNQVKDPDSILSNYLLGKEI